MMPTFVVTLRFRLPGQASQSENWTVRSKRTPAAAVTRACAKADRMVKNYLESVSVTKVEEERD